MHYQFNILFAFVATVLKGANKTGHVARIKAMTILLQGLLLLKQASLSGMGRGAAVIYQDKGFRGQLKRAHRWMKNEKIQNWETAAAFFAHMSQGLRQVFISVDWTDVGYFKVLEACLIVQGRGIPFYSLFVHKDELKDRQTSLELTMWYALMAMRQEGQTLLVAVDRGFAKFDWVGESPQYPFMHLVLRLKRTMILTWGTIRGQLQEWPLYADEVVEIEKAYLGKDAQVVTAVCIAHLSGNQESLYLACSQEDLKIALAVYQKRPAVEQQNRDLKSNFLIKKLHLRSAARLERMWIVMGMAFYISYCNESVHDTQFADRMSRHYKDERKDLSWLNLAKCAELCGHVDLILKPISVQ